MTKKPQGPKKMSARDARLTAYGEQWFYTRGDIDGAPQLGVLLHWPSLKTRYPDIWGLPVIRRSPGTDTRWRSAAFVGRWGVDGWLPDSRIQINLDYLEYYRDPGMMLRSLVHETVHAVQSRRLDLQHQNIHLLTVGYADDPLEQEARAVVRTIPGYLLKPR
jgi:hypothetical protein